MALSSAPQLHRPSEQTAAMPVTVQDPSLRWLPRGAQLLRGSLGHATCVLWTSEHSISLSVPQFSLLQYMASYRAQLRRWWWRSDEAPYAKLRTRPEGPLPDSASLISQDPCSKHPGSRFRHKRGCIIWNELKNEADNQRLLF